MQCQFAFFDFLSFAMVPNGMKCALVVEPYTYKRESTTFNLSCETRPGNKANKAQKHFRGLEMPEIAKITIVITQNKS